MEGLYLNNFRIALPAASVANGPALPPTDYKVGAEIQTYDNDDVGGGAGPGGIYRRVISPMALAVDNAVV